MARRIERPFNSLDKNEHHLCWERISWRDKSPVHNKLRTNPHMKVFLEVWFHNRLHKNIDSIEPVDIDVVKFTIKAIDKHNKKSRVLDFVTDELQNFSVLQGEMGLQNDTELLAAHFNKQMILMDAYQDYKKHNNILIEDEIYEIEDQVLQMSDSA